VGTDHDLCLYHDRRPDLSFDHDVRLAYDVYRDLGLGVTISCVSRSIAALATALGSNRCF
jgi:hypothetical protein